MALVAFMVAAINLFEREVALITAQETESLPASAGEQYGNIARCEWTQKSPHHPKNPLKYLNESVSLELSSQPLRLVNKRP
jgi:hypothetical protein